jgi:vacuolar-type H+-ATPase subunit E/Vma4
MDSAEPQAPMEESQAGARAADYATTERLIIRNANLDIVVQDTEETVDNLNAMAEELGGYVIESNLQQYEEGMEARLRIRVPADSLDTALNRIRELAACATSRRPRSGC